MAELKREGKVHHIGITNFDVAQMARVSWKEILMRSAQVVFLVDGENLLYPLCPGEQAAYPL